MYDNNFPTCVWRVVCAPFEGEREAAHREGNEMEKQEEEWEVRGVVVETYSKKDASLCHSIPKK
jgi:hypothetical protein